MKRQIHDELIVAFHQVMPRTSHAGQRTAHVNHVTTALFSRFGLPPSKAVERIVKRHLRYEGSPSSKPAILLIIKKLQQTMWFRTIVDNRRMSQFGKFVCGEATGLRGRYTLKHTNQAFNYFMHQELNYLIASFARANHRTLKLEFRLDGIKYGPVYIQGFKGPGPYTIRVSPVKMETPLSEVYVITNTLVEYLKQSNNLDITIDQNPANIGVILVKSANPFISMANAVGPKAGPINDPTISEAPCTEPKLSDKILELQDKLKTYKERTNTLQKEQSKLQEDCLLLTAQIVCLTQAQAIMKGE